MDFPVQEHRSSVKSDGNVKSLNKYSGCRCECFLSAWDMNFVIPTHLVDFVLWTITEMKYGNIGLFSENLKVHIHV